jgi:hypothetical protein
MIWLEQSLIKIIYKKYIIMYKIYKKYKYGPEISKI